jgi:dipeptidyl aminopeptidase/acylaminoacyl peptidase
MRGGAIAGGRRRGLGLRGAVLATLVFAMPLLQPLTLHAADRDGALLDSTRVILSEEAIARIETRQPNIRKQLAAADVYSITYLSDGLRVKGYLAVPREGGRLPCLILNRGGNRDFGAWTDERAVVRLGGMAAWGYVVVASQYRGNAGGEGIEEFGGRDVNDVLNLVPLLEAHPRADAARIGMWGWSRGGMMTYLALTRSDRIAAAVVGAGMADAFDNVSRRPDMETGVFAELVPDFVANRDSALAERSAVRWPEKLHKETPLLLLHGSADWRVHPTEALTMARKLYDSRHPFRFVFFEGGDHGLGEHAEEVDRLTRDWFDRYVRDRKPWPSLEPHGH